MNIKVMNRVVLFEYGDNNFKISQSCDNDICFCSLNSNLEIDYCFKSRHVVEWKSYELFMSLMKEVIGDYVLKKVLVHIFFQKIL